MVSSRFFSLNNSSRSITSLHAILHYSSSSLITTHSLVSILLHGNSNQPSLN